MRRDDWDDILEEKVSSELRQKTMERARRELGVSSPMVQVLRWLTPVVAATAGLFLYLRTERKKSKTTEFAVHEDEYLNELKMLSSEEIESLDESLIADLEFYEDLDVLEAWDESGES